ncbi:type II secretion system protein GspK [Venenivibrio stagnispumantis]|uniref:General secretion pathway protein K n=1 Tax=Venenivibrio stagnispumantis TaxID=407998 RepID=A0AA46ADP8_9AQUI|nr:general secretion pathway protein GspK [Venenivibrio stagnispumantis]MCW4573361.1 general secretion pathway protein GspK [Venenivibrio stagnispumantis]SMP06897.1 general secretion pathway protein K [Venenivibrio stagnispumantis]
MIIIFVISIITTLTFLLTSITDDIYIFQSYVNDYKNKEQLYLISDASLNAVKDFLLSDSDDIDTLQDKWATEMPLVIDNIKLKINIIDQERFLNPNILLNNDGKNINQRVFPVFERLFENIGYNKSLLFNIIDWIDKDSISQGGKENYTEYPAKNGFIDSLEEMKLIDGVTKEIYNGYIISGKFIPGFRTLFSPYSNGKININTASKWILQSLDPSLTEQIVANIISYREKKPFKNINDLSLVDGVNSDIIYRLKQLDIVDVKSENFLVDIEINLNDNIYHLTALLERKNKDINIIWRKIY